MANEQRPVLADMMTKELDFYAHADLFLNPTAETADIVLPVASAFEREGLKIGFEISEEAQSLVQLRPAVAPPPGEARPDTDIIFDLAVRLGLAEQFWNGDIDAAYRHQLAPTGITLEQLRANPSGVRLALQTRHAKHADLDGNAIPRGFATPSRKVFIDRYTVEMNVSKIETVDVVQSFWGRLLDYGTVVIRGTGTTIEPLSTVAAPLKLRSAIVAG